MKKSCSRKESSIVRKDKVDAFFAEPKESVKEFDQQKDLGKKSESQINCEHLEWQEKGNRVKHSPISEKFQRTSPRFSRKSGRAAKWICNSFENNEENTSKSKFQKEDFESPKNLEKTFNATKVKDGNYENKGTHSNDKQEQLTCENLELSKLHCKVNLKEHNTISGNSEGNSPNHLVGKKRFSLIEKNTGSPKKIKMEESVDNNINNNNSNNNDSNNSNNNNNNISTHVNIEKSLEIELELEKRRQNSSFSNREIKTIVAECDTRTTKWKETFSKYHCPARWGIPIVKNCTEKWDGKEIPPKLLYRYQKYLISKNMFHSIFLPSDSNITFATNNVTNNVSFNLKSDLNEDFKMNTVDETVADNSNNKALLEPFESEQGKSISHDEGKDRMVLRNRSQYKPVIIEEDEYISDDSDDWVTKQKLGRNKNVSKANAVNRKSISLNNQQLVSKLERFNINQRNTLRDEDDDLMGYNGFNQGDGTSKAESETTVCPICSMRFPNQLIESHATECANKTFKD